MIEQGVYYLGQGPLGELLDQALRELRDVRPGLDVL